MEPGVPVGLPVPTPRAPLRKRSLGLWLLAGFLGLGFLIFLFVVGMFFMGGERTSSLHFGKQIGVLEVEGMILESKEVVENLHDFLDADDIAAIVLRINSPGGGIVPSQEIYSEILKAREKKKIIVSMGSLAASGGYYIASAADTIVANPGTITGSIGVIMKLLDVQEIQNFLKLRSHTLKSGPFKDMGSPTKTLTAQEEAIFQHLIDEMRDQFVSDIARGRKMDVEKVSALADGRIYSGKEAKSLGLVDELGGFQDAVALAGKVAGIQGEPSIVYPTPKRRHFSDYFLSEKFEGLLFERLRGLTFEIPFFFSMLQSPGN